MKALLAITAALEAATGALLLLSPPLMVSILLGAALDAPAAHVAARIGGAALLSLGVACWLLARDDVASRAARGVVTAMLVYNIAAVAVLAYAGAVLGFANFILWSAVVVHAALAVWCGACLRSGPANAGE